MLTYEIKSIETTYAASSPATTVAVDLLSTTGNITTVDKTIKLALTGNFSLNSSSLISAITTEVAGTGYEVYFI